jgi:hypothetical protein
MNEEERKGGGEKLLLRLINPCYLLLPEAVLSLVLFPSPPPQ